MSNKKSFVMYIDSLDILDKLSDEQAGKLIKAIACYHKKVEVELDPVIDIVITPFISQFKRDAEKYEKTCKNRALAGAKGGKQKVANASKSKQKVANLADSDSDSDSDSDKDIKPLDQSKIDRDNFIKEAFEFWWSKWPKKVAKKSTFKIWQKITKSKTEDEVRALTNHIADDVALRMADIDAGGRKYIGFDMLHPSTYLNQERYNDDI